MGQIITHKKSKICILLGSNKCSGENCCGKFDKFDKVYQGGSI